MLALVVDAQIAVSEMVSIVLGREGTFAVVAEAASGFDGLKLMRKYKPALVITSLELPNGDGANMIATIRSEKPLTRILIFSGSRNRHLISAAMKAQPDGFAHKTEPLAILRKAIHSVAQGAGYFSPHACELLNQARLAGETENRLSPKERTVLQMVAGGMSSKQIASQLSVAPKTAEYYRMQIMRKLGLNNVAALTRYAVLCGLVRLE